MSGTTVKFNHAGDAWSLGDFGGLAANVLERARDSLAPVGSADQWRAVQGAVARAASRGRLFPPLVGPLRPTDGAGQTKAWHRVPANVWIALDGAWQYRSAKADGTSAGGSSNGQAQIDIVDLIHAATQLAADGWAELAQGNLRADGSAAAGVIYAPDAAMWLLPGAWLRSADDISAAAGMDSPPIAASRFLARTLAALFKAVQAELPPGAPLDAVRTLVDEFQKVAAAWVSENNVVLAQLQQAASRLNLPLLAVPVGGLARPQYEFRADGDLRKVDQEWLAHPQCGLKRYALLPLDSLGGRVPEVEAVNRELAKRSDLRVLVSSKTKEQNQMLFMFSAPAGEPTAPTDELLADLLPAATAAVQAMPQPRRTNRLALDWVRLMEDDRGVCCTWKARPEPDARFHLWWSSAPLNDDDWDAVASKASSSVVLDAGQRQYIIEVDTPQEIFAAMGIECRGERSAVKAADAPCRARPRRMAVTAPSAAAAAPATAPAATPPSPAGGPPQKCPGCQADVPAGRKFCPKCGGPMTARAPARQASAPSMVSVATAGEAIEVVRQLEREGQATRTLVRIGGQEREILEAPAASALARFWQALEAPTLAAAPQALPQFVSTDVLDGRLRVIAHARGGASHAWVDYCSKAAARNDLFGGLAAVARHALAALDFLHARGWSYGLMFPEHLVVDPHAERVQMAWPISPLALGGPAAISSAPAGFVCPEYGRPDEPVAPHWDLYALGITLLWGLAGKPPPESLSSSTLPELNPRIFVPDLPAGWGGVFARLLSKRKAGRFASAAEALAAIDRLAAPAAAPQSIQVAAGLHVGVTKVQLNPHNQDRLACSGPGGNLATATQTPFDGYEPTESYSTTAVEIRLPVVAAVADGVSTVDSGEFASASICRTIDEFGRNELAGIPSPGDAIAALGDRVNERLGIDVQQAVANDPTRSRWLTSFETPSSTLAALLLTSEKAAVAGAGDSRIYLLRSGLLEQLTVDGDQLTEYLREGLELSESLQRDDYKEIVGWIGRFAVVDGKIVPDQPLKVSQSPGFWRFEFVPRAGDVLLVCTDGLSDFVDAGLIDLVSILSANMPAEAARKLVDAANGCGGLDNIGVVVLRLTENESLPVPK